MTVCIAATVKGGKEIILVSDSKVAFGDFSADEAVVKNIPFIHPWAVLFAGDDISYANAIIDRGQKKGDSRRDESKRPLSGAEIAEILHEELIAERQRIIEAAILKKFGFTIETFRKRGKILCSESFYGDLIYRIAQIDISLKFLLAGFNEQTNDAEIWAIESDAPPQNYDRLGFWAIGSGANGAIASLAHAIEHHHFSRHRGDASDALYSILAAKFMAESAKDVGKGTFIVVLVQGGRARFFDQTDKVRTLWETQGAPRVPEGAAALIKCNWYIPKRRRRKK